MLARPGDVEESHKSLQFWRDRYRDQKAQLPSSAQTIQQGAMSTSPWRVMFTSQSSPPPVCLHKALLSSALLVATQEVAPPGSSSTDAGMPQEHVQHAHGCTGLAATGTPGGFNRLPELFLELLSHHSRSTQSDPMSHHSIKIPVNVARILNSITPGSSPHWGSLSSKNSTPLSLESC